ncbi:Hsp20/alpha crystallin family protein [Ancylostoma duodenale]|uniref:Hsp20/alpha crystallin family protein n=1 Tax=Ancylostoma duodenale TaxID=51022 RepID=A0A0C2CKZ8_9BILA|nr:Hsp20/alpha crystallin family protein [Ancylostoma duodenale]
MPMMTSDQDWFGRSLMPYWTHADHSISHVGNEGKEVVNDEKKFGVELNTSHFKPEELEVHLEGRDLTIEGKHEEKSEHGFIERSFIRKWALPEDCDLDAVHIQLTDDGHLCIEAPKTGHHMHRRTMPIMPAPKKK